MNESNFDPIDLFSAYMRVTGVPTLDPPTGDDPELAGKKLGVVNGASWITLWCNYFGHRILPGVEIVNVGNEAVQLNFMGAHHRGEPCPPQVNIDLFAEYARQLVELHGVDAILISCSTMNRAGVAVQKGMEPYGVPVILIDQAMMEKGVENGGKILVVATHGPTVANTQALLRETAERMNRAVSFTGVTVEEAFDLLGEGDIRGHNEVIARAIRAAQEREQIDIVLLAQLSMSVFKLSYPESRTEFGVEVLTSGETGFQRAGEVLRRL